MKKLTGKTSTILQWTITVILGLATIGTFADSVVAGFFMTLATVIACPITRKAGIDWMNTKMGDKSPFKKSKGWMYGVLAFLFVFISAGMLPASDATDVSLQNEFMQMEGHIENDDTLAVLAESNNNKNAEEIVIKSFESEESESNEQSEGTEQTEPTKQTEPTEQSEYTEQSDTTEVNTKTILSGVSGNQFSEVAGLVASGTIIKENSTLASEEPKTEPAKEAEIEVTPEPQPIPEPASKPEQNNQVSDESTGSYAVNSNNGKIHMVGACPATGNGDNAMKKPVYFNTFEDAEEYSIRNHPKQDKRRCGNCWR